jgi:hypothetical protein
MNEKETGAFAVAEMRNEKTNPSEEARAFMDDRTKLHLRDLEYRHAFHEAMRPTKEERDIRARLQASLLDKLGGRKDFEHLRQLARERIRAHRHPSFVSLLDGLESMITPFGDPAADGVEIWWAKTTWFWPVTKATVWMDGTGLHIAAKFELDDGDLHNYSIRVVAQFIVGAERMPPKGRNYLSNPVSETVGKAYGYTLPGGLFDFGDNWSKCWLNTKQTVFTLTGFDGIVKTVGFTSDSRQLVFIEDSYPQHVGLPDLRGLPVIFFLPVSTDALVVELEWEFHIQLEGEAGLWLGHQPEADVCTIRHPQWTIRGA